MTQHTVEDITTEKGNQLFLVRPAGPSGAAVMWLHWFDEAPNANRTQFLDEAKAMADRGVTSVLPQLTFPWQSPPTDIESDRARIESEKELLVGAYQTLKACNGVDPSRVGMVGHDFGAMHGMNLFGEVELAAAVLVAATPRWSDWFLRFWTIDSDRYDYMRALSVVDPITTVTRADFPLLFQFGDTDFYIAPMTGLELYNAAPEPKRLLSYDSGHDMGSAEITKDRTAFLTQHLGLGP
ncbi:MAG: alpha/beta hydrolase family protein [Acidimicrobiia bacterium]